MIVKRINVFLSIIVFFVACMLVACGEKKHSLVVENGDIKVDGETYLVQIEDEKEFNEIGNIIEDRLIEKYEKESAEE